MKVGLVSLILVYLVAVGQAAAQRPLRIQHARCDSFVTFRFRM